MGKLMRVVLVDDDVDVKYGIWEAIEWKKRRKRRGKLRMGKTG